MPPSLREAQRWLAGVILEPGGLDRAVREAPDTLTIAGDAARARLAAYADGYPARLEEALVEAFPALRHVLGHGTFRRLVERYRPHVPAGIWSLGDVGAALPAWIAGDEIAHALPLVPDLARLEFAVQRAFHAELEAPFDAAPLAAWGADDWNAARLGFQPGVALVRSPWPIRDVWEARTQPRETIDIDVEDRPQDVVVFRAGLRVCVEAVGADEAALLERLLGGTPLGEACERLAARDVPPEAVQAWLAGWVARGLVARCVRESGR